MSKKFSVVATVMISFMLLAALLSLACTTQENDADEPGSSTASEEMSSDLGGLTLGEGAILTLLTLSTLLLSTCLLLLLFQQARPNGKVAGAGHARPLGQEAWGRVLKDIDDLLTRHLHTARERDTGPSPVTPAEPSVPHETEMKLTLSRQGVGQLESLLEAWAARFESSCRAMASAAAVEGNEQAIEVAPEANAIPPAVQGEAELIAHGGEVGEPWPSEDPVCQLYAEPLRSGAAVGSTRCFSVSPSPHASFLIEIAADDSAQLRPNPEAKEYTPHFDSLFSIGGNQWQQQVRQSRGVPVTRRGRHWCLV